MLFNIPGMELTLRTGKFASVQLLYRFIFEEVGNRNNRKCLQNFESFLLETNNQKLLDKFHKLNSDFLINELASIGNILSIDASSTQDALCTRIVSYINDLNLLNENVLFDQNIRKNQLISTSPHLIHVAAINYQLCNIKVGNGCAEIDQKRLRKRDKKK